MKVREIFGNPRAEGLFGLEIEVEGERLDTIETPDGWVRTDDGSLRGDYPNQRSEFVFNGPASFEKSLGRLNELIAAAEKSRAVLNFSYRTSVHCHVNMQELTEKEVMNYIYLYYIMEDLIFELCGDYRKGNRFCLRLSDSEGCYDVILNLFQNGLRHGVGAGEDALRYAALNVAALTKYGSIEFRGMEGNMDKDRLAALMQVLHDLRKLACRFKDPSAVYAFYKDNPSRILDSLKNKELFAFEGSDLLLQHAMCRTIEFPFATVIKGE